MPRQDQHVAPLQPLVDVVPGAGRVPIGLAPGLSHAPSAGPVEEAVDGDAGPHHVEVALWKMQDGGRICHVADGHRQAVLLIKAQDFIKAFHLQAGMGKVSCIGISKM